MEIEKVIKEAMGHEINVYRSQDFFLELVPQNVDKAASLDSLLQQLGMNKEELIACGDGFNDLSMIQYAGLGVAMEMHMRILKERQILLQNPMMQMGLPMY